eukprot:6626551-Pyramimonas_sp.AAC.1
MISSACVPDGAAATAAGTAVGAATLRSAGATPPFPAGAPSPPHQKSARSAPGASRARAALAPAAASPAPAAARAAAARRRVKGSGGKGGGVLRRQAVSHQPSSPLHPFLGTGLSSW